MQGRSAQELFEVEETLEKTLEAYYTLAVDLPNVVLVDGMGSPPEVFERVKRVVRKRLLFFLD